MRIETIEDQHFIKSFWTYLYQNIGLSLKHSSHYLAPAYKGSGRAEITFDTPAIIEEDWMKRKTLEVISGFLETYNFNVQKNGEEFILHRVVTTPINLEHFTEEYAIEVKMSDNKCRIKITDIAKK
ncbi:MAG: hypothetical protein Q7R52_01395 [archaeon]|nr:hypothetical protein [archaeon]